MSSTPKTRGVFAGILLVMLCTIMYFSGEKSKAIDVVRLIDRADAILILDADAPLEGAPKILEALVSSELSTQLSLSVRYFAPESDGVRYVLSVYPDHNDWRSNEVALEAGANNTAEITISFAPNPPMKQKSESTVLNFVIQRFENDQPTGAVYERPVDFPKVWMR